VQRWPRFHDARAVCCIASPPVVVDEYDVGLNVTTNERPSKDPETKIRIRYRRYSMIYDASVGGF
jgi:hypothetical protein